MRRSPLLLEALIKKTMTRQGPIYSFRKPAGPPAHDDIRTIKFIWDATQRFDLTPIIQGDQQQARWAAQDYIEHLKRRARAEGIPFEKVRERIKRIGPHMRRSLATFYTYLDGRARTG